MIACASKYERKLSWMKVQKMSRADAESNLEFLGFIIFENKLKLSTAGVISELNEDSVCVGDRFQIGTGVVEVSQPRKPCERLSKNTENQNTQQTIYRSGWSGWYVRVVQAGVICKGDKLHLLSRPHPEFTIRHLNRLLSAPNHADELEQALALEVLAPAFKRSLNSQLMKLQEKQS